MRSSVVFDNFKNLIVSIQCLFSLSNRLCMKANQYKVYNRDKLLDHDQKVMVELAEYFFGFLFEYLVNINIHV